MRGGVNGGRRGLQGWGRRFAVGWTEQHRPSHQCWNFFEAPQKSECPRWSNTVHVDSNNTVHCGVESLQAWHSTVCCRLNGLPATQHPPVHLLVTACTRAASQHGASKPLLELSERRLCSCAAEQFKGTGYLARISFRAAPRVVSSNRIGIIPSAKPSCACMRSCAVQGGGEIARSHFLPCRSNCSQRQPWHWDHPCASPRAGPAVATAYHMQHMTGQKPWPLLERRGGEERGGER